jgi:hypothetical protein
LACKEREITKREQIAAELEAKLTAINKEYDLKSKALEYHHEEIMRLYQIAEDMLKRPEVIANSELTKNLLILVANGHSKAGDNLAAMFSSLSLGRLR